MKNLIQLLTLILSLTLASCTMEDPCDDTFCLNAGVCIDGTCICADGYTGVNCENRIGGDGAVVFWNYQGDYINVVDVTIDGLERSITTDWLSTDGPSCSNCSGCANFSLSAGTYTYSARERGTNGASWSRTFSVAEDGCSRVRLTR